MQGSQKARYHLVLIGAYGRTYENKKDAIRDWEQGLDFKVNNGRYCSIRDLNTLIADTAGVHIQTKQGYVRVA